MKKTGIVIAVLLLAIGFAAKTATLMIDGNSKILTDLNDFVVYFSNVIVDGESDPSLINDSKNQFIFSSDTLISSGDSQEFQYTIRNDSTQYDAEVSVECVPNSVIDISLSNNMPNSYIEAGSEQDGIITIEATGDNPDITEFTCTLNVTAIERTEAGGSKILPEVMYVSTTYPEAIWEYKEDITNIVIQDEMNAITDAAYSFDISANEDGSVMAYMVENSDQPGTYTTYIQGDGGFALGEDGSDFFREFSQLVTIEGLEYLDTSNTTSLESFFRDCVSLESVDVSHFNTSKVETFYNMFSHCDKIVTADISSFDFSSAENISGMFEYCYALEEIDFGSSTTPNLISTYQLFYHCESLKRVDISNLDTSDVLDMSAMFSYCRSLESIDLSNFVTTRVNDMSNMFYHCESMTNLDLSSFDTSSVLDMTDMFRECNVLENLNFSNAVFSSVESHTYMFHNVETELSILAKDEEAASWLEERLAEDDITGTVTVAG